MNKNLTKISAVIDEISMGPFGSDIKVDNFVSDGFPVLNGSNLTGFKLVEDHFKYVTPEKAKTFKKAIAKRGDIVITHRGTLGQISFIPDNSKYDAYVISQSQFRVSLKRELVDPAFFVYYFHTKEGQKRLLANKCHVGVPALAQATTNFRLIEIPLPSLTIQKKITSLLSSLDSKIELNNRINAELEAMAKTLYDYWFVQFDFPDAQGMPYKSSGGKMVWSGELGREVPEGWLVDNILNVGKLLGGGTPKTNIDSYWDGLIPFYTPSDSTKSFFVLDTEKHISKIGLESCSSKLYPKGTIFITARGTVGSLNIAAIDMAMNQSCYAIAPKKEINYYYLYQCCFDMIQYLKAKANGSIFDAIVSNDIKLTPICIPPSELIKSYGERMESVYEKALVNLNENQTLISLRYWLLPMLMNGQVRVE